MYINIESLGDWCSSIVPNHICGCIESFFFFFCIDRLPNQKLKNRFCSPSVLLVKGSTHSLIWNLNSRRGIHSLRR